MPKRSILLASSTGSSKSLSVGVFSKGSTLPAIQPAAVVKLLFLLDLSALHVVACMRSILSLNYEINQRLSLRFCIILTDDIT
jgi:hypothetical protein